MQLEIVSKNDIFQNKSFEKYYLLDIKIGLTLALEHVCQWCQGLLLVAVALFVAPSIARATLRN